MDQKIFILRSNKREKTITIRKEYGDGTFTTYKSVRLPQDEFDYMVNYATENDIKQFLKTDDYYILR